MGFNLVAVEHHRDICRAHWYDNRRFRTTVKRLKHKLLQKAYPGYNQTLYCLQLCGDPLCINPMHHLISLDHESHRAVADVVNSQMLQGVDIIFLREAAESLPGAYLSIDPVWVAEAQRHLAE